MAGNCPLGLTTQGISEIVVAVTANVTATDISHGFLRQASSLFRSAQQKLLVDATRKSFSPK